MAREECGSMYCSNLASCDIGTLRLSIHESIASPSELLLRLHTEHLLLLQLIVRFCKNAFCFPTPNIVTCKLCMDFVMALHLLL